MNSNQLLAMGLGLHSPWVVLSSELKERADGKALHIHIDFKRGSQFKDETGSYCSVHDTVEKTWRHLSFFEHASLIPVRHESAPPLVAESATGKA